MNIASQSWLPSFFRTLFQDMGFGLRQLRKSPGFAVVVIGSLALGIGASVAIFSVVRAVLLDPFPYQGANRMVHVELTQKNSERYDYLMVNTAGFQDLQQLAAVDDVFLMNNRLQALTGDALPVSVNAGYYSSNLFTYMGVPPLLGREFTPADVPGGNASPVVVLSYLFWKKQFGGRQDILNRRIELDHVPYTVIGVASPRFTWGDSDVYIPSNFNADPHAYMSAFLKLKPGASFAAATAALQPMVDSYARQDPTNYPQNSKIRIQALSEEAMHGFKAPLLVLFAAVLLLLLVGCANVSILMLARGAARQQEFAVRSSIGASRGRIMRQLLAESMMLSLVGATAGDIHPPVVNPDHSVVLVGEEHRRDGVHIGAGKYDLPRRPAIGRLGDGGPGIVKTSSHCVADSWRWKIHFPQEARHIPAQSIELQRGRALEDRFPAAASVVDREDGGTAVVSAGEDPVLNGGELIVNERKVRYKRTYGLPVLTIRGPYQLTALQCPPMNRIQEMQTTHVSVVRVGIANLDLPVLTPVGGMQNESSRTLAGNPTNLVVGKEDVL